MHLMSSRGAKLGDAKVVNKMICNNCSGAPKTDLRCTGCGTNRPLDHFSSTQRNDPDTAMCRKCISEIENIMPGQQEHEVDGSDEEYAMVSTYQQHVPNDITYIADHGR